MVGFWIRPKSEIEVKSPQIEKKLFRPGISPRRADLFLVLCRPPVYTILGAEDNPMIEFVICIDNGSNPASLILGKVYRRLPDAEAETHNMFRVVDEDASEPHGYLYPASIFVPVELPESAQRALAMASG
jgi:hypothetical protein